MIKRRTIKDLRILCKGASYNRVESFYVSDQEKHLFKAGDWIALYLNASGRTTEYIERQTRLRRLNEHGWISDTEYDPGEAYWARLTEEGAAILNYWYDLKSKKALTEKLKEGAPAFIDAAYDKFLYY